MHCFPALSLLPFRPSCVFQVASFKAHHNVFGAPTLADSWSCQFSCTTWVFLTREVLKRLWTQILLWPACWFETKWSLLRQSGQVSKSNILVLLSFVKKIFKDRFLLCFVFAFFRWAENSTGTGHIYQLWLLSHSEKISLGQDVNNSLIQFIF